MNFERFRVPPDTAVKLKDNAKDQSEPFGDKSEA